MIRVHHHQVHQLLAALQRVVLAELPLGQLQVLLPVLLRVLQLELQLVHLGVVGHLGKEVVQLIPRHNVRQEVQLVTG